MRPIQLLLLFLTFSCLAQQQDAVDFTKINVEIFPVFDENEIRGKGVYEFEVLEKVDSVFLDAISMNFVEAQLNGSPIEFSNSGKQFGIKAPEEQGKHRLFLRYLAKPKQTVYFFDRGSSLALQQDQGSSTVQVWTQGQGKYTSHWLPSIDDMNDKIEFDLSFRIAPGFKVIANGKLKSFDSTSNGKFYKNWNFDMTHPMSSYLAAFVIGDFDSKVVHSSSGVPIVLYYEPDDSLKFEPTYRYTKEIFDFLEEEIGVPYPWQNYKQVPVQDFLYAGMENTTCTIFSNQYVIDSTAFVDKNYVNVNAHELAHQWFGNMVTEFSGEHHWLHEGFATYYAYLAEKELFGEAHFYWKLYQTAKTLDNVSQGDGGEALIDPNANSLTFYEKGAWALVMLRDRLGDQAFKKGIKNYLEIYAYKNSTIANFLTEMEQISGMDLEEFQQTWLESEEYPWDEVRQYLQSKSTSVKTYFEIQSTMDSTEVLSKERLLKLWGKETSIPFKRQLVLDYFKQIPNSGIQYILENESLEVRQAVALATPKISVELKKDFESLLMDKSYMTQEAVLFKLWEAFPENRTNYLNKTKEIVGLPNKNVRLLWLTLALVTPEFQPENSIRFYQELNRYTQPQYNFEVRQLTFQYLFQIQALSDGALESLIQACGHHVWQFKKSSRNLIRKLYKSEEGKNRLLQLRNSLPEKEKRILESLINP